MTLFVVLGLVTVVIGVLVAVAFGLRLMRADDDRDSPGADSELTDPDDVGSDHRSARRRADRGRQGTRQQGTRRTSGRAWPDDYAGRRGHRGRSGQTTTSAEGDPAQIDRALGTDPGFATDPGLGTEYQQATGWAVRSARGGQHGDRDGYERRPAPATGSAAELPRLRDKEPVPGAATKVTRAVSRPTTDDIPDPRVFAGAGRRRLQQKAQPKTRSRPPRDRGGHGSGDGSSSWNDTNWDSVSDEDYWAELSADKPLASRTAQSAADLRPPDCEPKKRRDARTDRNLADPGSQTATKAMPEVSTTRQPSAGRVQHEVPALPVRRSGCTTDTGRTVPAGTRSAGHAAADYADPNLALLASLGEPAGEGRGLRAAGDGTGSAAAGQPATPPGGWPGGGPGQRDWSQRGQESVAAMGNQAGYQSAPPEAYRSPSYGASSKGEHQARGYATNTPGYGVPASAGHAAGTSYDTAPDLLPRVPSRGTTVAVSPDQTAGQVSGDVQVSGSPGGGYSGSHAAGWYDTASYGAASRTTASYRAGSYGNSYGAAAGSHAAPDAGRVPQNVTNGGPAGETWARTGPADIGGPAGAAAMTGYSPSATNGSTAAFSASTPATPAGGIPRAQGGDFAHGSASRAHAGGFASGYLSSSALSARHGVTGPEPLASAGSNNPYGSYLTHPATPAGDAMGASPRWQPRHSDTSGGYDPQRSYGGYRDFGGGSRR